MANKTKTELLEEIEAKNAAIENLKKEVEKLERFKQYETMTDEMAVLRDSFVNSGFTKSEAFEMVKMIMQNTILSQMTSSKVSYRSCR
jgi:hypothetical protein